MDRFDMIFKLLRSLDEKQDKQSETLARVEQDLKYHIKRTDLLEDAVKNVVRMPSIRQVAAFIGIIGTLIGIAVSLRGL